MPTHVRQITGREGAMYYIIEGRGSAFCMGRAATRHCPFVINPIKSRPVQVGITAQSSRAVASVPLTQIAAGAATSVCTQKRKTAAGTLFGSIGFWFMGVLVSQSPIPRYFFSFEAITQHTKKIVLRVRLLLPPARATNASKIQTVAGVTMT